MITNIYYLLKQMDEGQKFSKSTISAQEVSILDSLVSTKKITFSNGYYSKVNKADRQDSVGQE